MSHLRTTIVAFVALAVAVFPLAGASAHSVTSAPQDSGQHVSADCGKMGQSKADQANCGQFSGCSKCQCLGLTAVLTATPGTRSSQPSTVKTGPIADSAPSLAYIPPSPPPRV